MPGAVILDLDGTLLDTIDDIAAAMNAALVDHGYGEVPVGEVRTRVGWGLKRLVTLSIPPDDLTNETLLTSLIDSTRSHYRAVPVERSQPYPGMAEIVAELYRREVPMAILSNKPDDLTQVVVRHALMPALQALLPGMDDDSSAVFRAVQGHRDGVPAKPDPQSTNALVGLLGAGPGEIAFVGDTEVDMETAVAAGCIPVGVSWGFRSAEEVSAAGARHLCHTHDELRDVLGLPLSEEERV